MTSEEAQRVFDAINGLTAIEDPAERAKAIGEVLKAMPQRSKDLKELRQAAVQAMLARDGATYRSVAAELDIHFVTVRDIAQGYSGSGKARPKKASAEEVDSE